MWVSASQRIALSVLARNPHKELVREISYETGRRGNARFQYSQQERVVNRNQREATARRGARICGTRGWVGQRERMSQCSWWLCGNFARIHVRDSPQMHSKLPKSVPNFSLLALGANPSPCLFVFLFLHLSIVYVVLCVYKEM